MHPRPVVGVDQRPEIGARGPSPRRPAASARARSARRGTAPRSSGARARARRDPHDWPAPANALAATWPAAHSGSTPASTIARWLPAASSPGRITRSTPGWVASGRAARSSPWRSCRIGAEVEQLGQALGGQRRLLDGLSTTALPVDERRGERAAASRPAGRSRASGSRPRRAARAAPGRRAAAGRARAARARRTPRTRRSRPRRRRASPRAARRPRASAARPARARARAAGAPRPSAASRARRARCAPRRRARRGGRDRVVRLGHGAGGNVPIGSPVAGSSTASSDALTPRSSMLMSLVRRTRRPPGRTLVESRTNGQSRTSSSLLI